MGLFGRKKSPAELVKLVSEAVSTIEKKKDAKSVENVWKYIIRDF